MGRPASMIGFIDEAGVPEIPCLAKSKKKAKAVDEVFCMGFVFMPMYYWLTLRNTYDLVRTDFGIPIDQELKWRNLLRGTGPAAHLQASGAYPFIEELEVYFCDPQSPWQRGSNENTNGLLRQYFPRRESLAGVTQERLDEVAAKLNRRPRKTLGFKTPAEKLTELIDGLGESAAER